MRGRTLIYAGHKLGLKHVLPEAYPMFEETRYAPWLVLNFVLRDHFRDSAFWQNEWLGKETDFLGFVDSDAQYNPNPKKRVLTTYFCLPEDQRSRLTSLDDRSEARRWAIRAMELLNRMFSQPIDELVEIVYIKAMGHAMPIPEPGLPVFAMPTMPGPTVSWCLPVSTTGACPSFSRPWIRGIQAVELL